VVECRNRECSAVHIVMHSDNPWKSAITTLPKQTATTGLQHVLSIGEELGLLPGPASDASGIQDFCTSVTLYAEAASLDAELKAGIPRSIEDWTVLNNCIDTKKWCCRQMQRKNKLIYACL